MLIQLTKAAGKPILVNADQICAVVVHVEWDEPKGRQVVYSRIEMADSGAHTVVEPMSKIWKAANGFTPSQAAPFTDWLPAEPQPEEPE